MIKTKPKYIVVTAIILFASGKVHKSVIRNAYKRMDTMRMMSMQRFEPCVWPNLCRN